MEIYVNKRKNEEWEESKISLVANLFFNERKNVDIFTKIKSIDAEVLQLITGHCPLNQFLFRIKKRENGQCACGADKEAVWHFLWTANCMKKLGKI